MWFRDAESGGILNKMISLRLSPLAPAYCYGSARENARLPLTSTTPGNQWAAAFNAFFTLSTLGFTTNWQ